MNATKFLRQDHDELRAIFKKLDANPDEDRAQDLYDDLEELLVAHTQIEEELFYPAARDLKGLVDLVEKALAEHGAVDGMCNEIADIEPSDASFRGKVAALRDAVLHHLEEEENKLFPELERQCSQAQLDSLGRELEQRKNEILERETEEV